ncbi:hypothetical protein [Flavobacterium psychrophilum]|uniref:hypothetical protein n=1 Tax=Flavobacterium psychrophilum TaxID=96345 RepID=UPI001C8F91FF|nr:hypothetical protein [Flavobacterium psychrophilum]QZK98181.1 hypothetical protein K5L05_00395 [Flavobacterium psychrophilum]
MKKKQKKTSTTLNELIVFNNALYKVLFCPKKFQRQYRRFFKFSASNEHTIYLKSKTTKNTIKIKIEGEDYYLVSYSGTIHGYLLYAVSQKELIQKMIKHNIY